MNEFSKKIQIIIADDHPIVIAGLKQILERHRDISVVATTCSTFNLANLIAKINCDVLICDLSFSDEPTVCGLTLISQLIKQFPDLMVIVLTGSRDNKIIDDVLRRGVADVFFKADGNLNKLPDRIRALVFSRRYPDGFPAFARSVRGRYSRDEGRVDLSKREYEIVKRLVEGSSVTAIAGDTGRSVKTISTQKASAMMKLGAENNIELVDKFRNYDTFLKNLNSNNEI